MCLRRQTKVKRNFSFINFWNMSSFEIHVYMKLFIIKVGRVLTCQGDKTILSRIMKANKPFLILSVSALLVVQNKWAKDIQVKGEG